MSNAAKAQTSQKACSICALGYPIAEFTYGGRDNRSYCKSCDKLEKAAYVRGGAGAALHFREEMRSKWRK